MAEIVRRRSWGGVLPLGRHVSISGSRSIHAPSVSIAPSSFQEEIKRPASQTVQARTGPRMSAVFESIHARAQNLSVARLFDLQRAGRTRFILTYLDQRDAALACPPRDIVPRESVTDYPTDFSAMP